MTIWGSLGPIYRYINDHCRVTVRAMVRITVTVTVAVVVYKLLEKVTSK